MISPSRLTALAEIFMCPPDSLSPCQIECANQHRAVRLCRAGEVFPARLFLDRLPVGPVDIELVLVVTLEVIVQGFPADGAPYLRLAILPPEDGDTAVKNVLRLDLGEN